MCFIASSKICKLQLAKEDIVVYKIVGKPKYKRYFWHPWDKYLASVESGVRGFKYKVGQLNKWVTIKRQIDDGKLLIEEGYHSYASLTMVRCQYLPMYAYVVKCIIPKGSHYYKYNDYCVSSNIIITDELCAKSV